MTSQGCWTGRAGSCCNCTMRNERLECISPPAFYGHHITTSLRWCLYLSHQKNVYSLGQSRAVLESRVRNCVKACRTPSLAPNTRIDLFLLHQLVSCNAEDQFDTHVINDVCWAGIKGLVGSWQLWPTYILPSTVQIWVCGTWWFEFGGRRDRAG